MSQLCTEYSTCHNTDYHSKTVIGCRSAFRPIPTFEFALFQFATDKNKERH